MPRCFVPGCKSGYDSVLPSSEKRHFFKPPRDAERLALWQRAVPRQDKKLSSTCSICDLHFSDEDISKVFEHNICGELVTMPRDKWALKDDAVPRLFLNCPSYLSKPTRKRKAPARRLSPAKSKRRKGQVALSENLEVAVCANGRIVPRSVYAGEPSIEMNSFDDLKCLIRYIEKLKLCQGCPVEKYPKIASSLVAKKGGNLRINFGHYVTLYETEKNKHVRVVPKLTEAHVAPDNLRKMSVRLATQLFSRGTAVGIRVYREAKVTGLEDSEGTETFTRMVNDVFDALNIKLPSRGIRRNSKEIQASSSTNLSGA
ncbi:hypothetical protein HPB51_021439 [Rhipicephalus microplus]|uniref:THAP-type domain-containing protein n=1 Tax=Rhipicephalus microplus TaxID=6941 RepID=A0A9J6DXD8_RHIMP|nr:hypothetical protein HPB51_021439 [Rhipicephalus microplus]